MADPFASARYKLNHAKRRIEDLEREIAAFIEKQPYAKVIEPNADGTANVHKVKMVHPMPDLPGLLSEIVSGLRAALDHACFAVAEAAGRHDSKKATFPIGDSLDDVKTKHLRGGQSKDVPKKVFEAIVALRPHKGGNDLYWVLHQLCNTDKHREVIRPQPGTHLPAGEFRQLSGPSAELHPAIWDAAKNEAIFAVVPNGAVVEYKLQITALVTIYDPETMDPYPASIFLRDLASLVESSLAVIESAARPGR